MLTPNPYSYVIRSVTRVIDGDTVDCVIDLGFDMQMNARIRLAGIDTPESRTRDLEEKRFGKYAKEWLTNHLVGTNMVVQTEYNKEKGKYGRVIGTLWVDGVNLNHLMLEEHIAVEYSGGNKEEIAAKHLENRKILTERGLA
jgi:micrococcal nuclease